MADLDERHAQQHREFAASQGNELARYLKEREAARELASDIEAQRRLEEKRTRDSPDRAR